MSVVVALEKNWRQKKNSTKEKITRRQKCLYLTKKKRQIQKLMKIQPKEQRKQGNEEKVDIILW